MSIKKFFFDLETTGTDRTIHAIHQIAAIIEIDGEIVHELDIKAAPPEDAKIEQEALDACGVTLEQIMAYQPKAKAQAELISTLNKFCDKFNKKDKMFLVGYNNAGFDNRFLRSWWPDAYFGSYFWPNSIDVMVLATQELLDDRPIIPNFQLGTVAEVFECLPDEAKLHDALVDVRITRDIYLKLVNK